MAAAGAAATKYGRGLSGLLKQGWNEYPEIVGSSVLGVIGLGFLSFATWRYYANDGDNKRYKDKYTVYRPDDPRVQKIRE